MYQSYSNPKVGRFFETRCILQSFFQNFLNSRRKINFQMTLQKVTFDSKLARMTTALMHYVSRQQNQLDKKAQEPCKTCLVKT